MHDESLVGYAIKLEIADIAYRIKGASLLAYNLQ
jgi:hypothetical protein